MCLLSTALLFDFHQQGRGRTKRDAGRYTSFINETKGDGYHR